jgi:hypothetical protein
VTKLCAVTKLGDLTVLFYFLYDEEKNLAQFPRIIEVFTQKIVTKPSKIWVWDPGSEIRDPRSGIRDPGSEIRKKPIPDPGVKKAPDPGSGSATLGEYLVYMTLYSKPI